MLHGAWHFIFFNSFWFLLHSTVLSGAARRLHSLPDTPVDCAYKKDLKDKKSKVFFVFCKGPNKTRFPLFKRRNDVRKSGKVFFELAKVWRRLEQHFPQKEMMLEKAGKCFSNWQRSTEDWSSTSAKRNGLKM
jgi:hypothetical protein